MGYNISAFIAHGKTFTELKWISDRVTVAPLNQGFELMLDDDYLRQALKLPESPWAIGFEDIYLRQSMVDFALELSKNTPLAYIHAGFFGGNGTQYAALWKDGELVLKPETNNAWYGHAYLPMPAGDMPINTVLRLMDVKATPPEDEFIAVGLPKHRQMEDWFAAYTRYTVRDYTPDDI